LSAPSNGIAPARREHVRVVSPDHHCERVDELDDGYVLVCTCGWRSPVEPTAEAVGAEWDRHRDIASS
jgi:hypothetical protein